MTYPPRDVPPPLELQASLGQLVWGQQALVDLLALELRAWVALVSVVDVSMLEPSTTAWYILPSPRLEQLGRLEQRAWEYRSARRGG